MSESPAKFESRTILLVDTRIAALRRTSDLLRRAGHYVVEAASFDDAKKFLATRTPALVISGLRLAAFNGLHLVHLARLNRPEMSAIIVSSGADAVLQSEAERVGASLLVEPVPPPDLLSLIDRMLEADVPKAVVTSSVDRRRSERRGAGNPADVALDRRVADRRVAVRVPVWRDGISQS
jgi:DNA-binding NtrC family response regulator